MEIIYVYEIDSLVLTSWKLSLSCHVWKINLKICAEEHVIRNTIIAAPGKLLFSGEVRKIDRLHAGYQTNL